LRNHTVGIHSARQGIVQRNRIAQGVSKDALALIGIRYSRRGILTLNLPIAFKIAKVEDLALQNFGTGPPMAPPNWFFTNTGFTDFPVRMLVGGVNGPMALKSVLRLYSQSLPWR
jgi:hypothetical protein